MLKCKKIISGFLALTLVFPFSNHLMGIGIKSSNKNQYELKRAVNKLQLLSIIKKKQKLNARDTIYYTTQQKSENVMSGSSHSNTNIQVEGVDEADIIKTDGKYIYLISTNKNQLNIFEATERPKKIYTLDAKVLLNQKEPKEFKGYTKNIYISEMFLYKNSDKNYLVTISNVNRYKENPIYPTPYKTTPEISNSKMSIMPPIYYDNEDTTLITVLDLKNINNPTIVKQFEVAGYTLTSRLKDDKFYLINNKGTKYYIMRNTNNTNNNILPYYIDYGDEAVKKEFDIKDIRYNEKNIDGSYTIISQFDLNTMNIQNQAVLGYFENIYMSLDNIYLTTTRTSYMEEYPFRIRINPNYYEKTLVYKFGIDKNVEYKGCALVDGRIINQFSMDEYDGYFRIATTENNMQFNSFESTNNVYIIDKNMNIVGSIKNIAPGERIYSTRFMKDKLYMVTFKQVDPLFVIDLKTPTQPKILGLLKIPGYSTYLHPYNENTIIGFGMDTGNDGDRVFNKGMKVALFDVSNVNEPKQKASLEIGGKGTYSPTLYNHKALMEYKKYNVYALEVSEASNDDRYNLVFNGVYLLQIKDDNIEVKTKVSHIQDNMYYMGYKTIFVNNLMYVFSEDAVSVIDLDSMKEIYQGKI